MAFFLELCYNRKIDYTIDYSYESTFSGQCD